MNLPPNVTATTDRHGKIRYRFRKKGLPSAYIQSRPGTAQFQREYERCLAAPAQDRQRRGPAIRRLRGIDVVYFIGPDEGPIKIGTSQDVQRRLYKLQTASPKPLRILAMVRGNAALEAKLHTRFKRCRIKGEWFDRTPELEQFLDDLRNAVLSNFAADANLI